MNTNTIVILIEILAPCRRSILTRTSFELTGALGRDDCKYKHDCDNHTNTLVIIIEILAPCIRRILTKMSFDRSTRQCFPATRSHAPPKSHNLQSLSINLKMYDKNVQQFLFLFSAVCKTNVWLHELHSTTPKSYQVYDSGEKSWYARGLPKS